MDNGFSFKIFTNKNQKKMIKKLLLLVICFLTFSFANAQLNSVAIVGDGAGGWPSAPIDTHQMTTTDGMNWTLNNLTLTVGSVKFRGNNSWDLPYNWGGTVFPSGTAVVDANGITSAAGIYNVSFNSNTLAYKFEKQGGGFQVISIFGDATPGAWTTDTDMTTTDGNIYTLKNVSLIAGALKFRGDHSWTLPYNWGGTAFPSGTAIVDAPGITIPTAGLYDVTFTKTTLQYSFTFQVVSIFGDATPGAWTTDTDMSTTDGNIYTLNNVSLIAGALKFRGDHSWALPYNWGGTAFPSGTAVVDANGIAVPTAGNYNISFNKTTLAYSFTTTLAVNDFDTITFKVYPNPTQNNWFFSSSKENIESIVIVDITGKTVKTATPKSNEANIDASNLTAGLYVAKVATATATQTLKLIKE
jgi:hypothetical protein